MIKLKALKQVSALVTIGREEKWVFLKAGQELDGVGMVVGVDPIYAPNAPIQTRGGKNVAIFPISENSPNDYLGLFETLKS